LCFDIEIDGGITLENIDHVASSGVEIFVAGSSVFKAEDVQERTAEFLKKIKKQGEKNEIR
ncbi:MAG: hypothetical protein RR626_08145, partial [Anaerovoracaceae bacterium]